MNYIRHLHAFYHQVKRDERLSSTHVSLYMALFQYWNYNRFQNPFRIDRDELMQLSKIGSKNTYHKCMKELHDYRYLLYHSGITKYQNVKVSMVRFDLKPEENGLKQLDLFSAAKNESHNSNVIIPTERSLLPSGATDSAIAEEGWERSSLEGVSSTGINTHQCPGFDTHSCPKNGTACVPDLTATCPKNGTTCVPLLGHNIKHKQINSKQCVFKTGKNTPTQIFEKNKKMENAIAKMAGLNGPETNEKQGPPRNSNSVHHEPKMDGGSVGATGVSLPVVEIYFRENSFPVAEAQKFFYYNQGRGWMLTDTLPIRDWQALAHKWMLNNINPKSDQHGKSGKQPNQHIDPGPGKDYSEPL